MRRFHNEVTLLVRRVRLGQKSHAQVDFDGSLRGQNLCGCSLGTFRKSRPLGKCSNKKCSVCKVMRACKHMRKRRIRRMLKTAEFYPKVPGY